MRTPLADSTEPSAAFRPLLEASQGGDNNAFGRLWELYLEESLSKLATKRLPRQMQGRVRTSDIVSDAARRVWEHLRDFRGRTPEELRGWARRILSRELARASERDRRRKDIVRLERPADGESSGERLDVRDTKTHSPSSEVGNAEEVERLKQDHSELEWRLLVLWGEDRSWKDIADILDSEFGDRRGPDAWRMYLKRLIIEQKKKRGISDGP